MDMDESAFESTDFDQPESIHLGQGGDNSFPCKVCGKRFSSKSYVSQHMRSHTGERPFVCGVCDKAFYQKATLIFHEKVHGNDVFSCNFCDKTFPCKKRKALHMRVHTKPYVCDVCDKAFCQKSLLNDHLSKHGQGEKKLFSCKVCGKKFCNKNYVLQHMRSHTGERPYVCGVCNRAFVQKAALKCHEKVHGNDVFSCDFCDKTFPCKKRKALHMRVHTKPYVCDVCDKAFCQKSLLNDHLSKHGQGEKKLFSCKVCRKQFCNKNYVLQHMRSHTGERPYVCGVCNRAFVQKAALKCHEKVHGNDVFSCDFCDKTFPCKKRKALHMRVHTKPYVCDVCDKAFCQKSLLNDHLSKHGQGEKKLFSCKECGKQFCKKNYVLQHMRSHTGERPYVCGVCNMAFVQKAALKCHEKTHEEKVFSCDVCEEKFACEKRKVLHMRVHTKPYICSICEKAFSQKSLLNDHVKKHGEKTLSCSECGKLFYCQKAIERHMRIHTGETPHPCSLCNRRFAHRSSLLYHLKIHERSDNTGRKSIPNQNVSDSVEKLFYCSNCSMEFQSNLLLERQMKGSGEENVFLCSVCGARFHSKRGFSGHMSKHAENKTLLCQVCNMSSSAETNSENVCTDPHGQRWFWCAICGRRFTDIASMTEHVTVHLSQVPLKWGDVYTFYDNKLIEVKHTRLSNGKIPSKHMHSFEPYYCTECKERFADVGQLHQHIEQHRRKNLSSPKKSKDRDFKTLRCGECSRHLSANLVIDVAVLCLEATVCPKSCYRIMGQEKCHEDDTVFCKTCMFDGEKCCVLCGETVKLCDLRSHVGLHTGELAQCKECGEIFCDVNAQGSVNNSGVHLCRDQQALHRHADSKRVKTKTLYKKLNCFSI